jgi:ABC-2 type transport system permease protein
VTEYLRGAGVSFEHALTTFLRRRRTLVAAALVVLPAFLPLLVLVIPHEHNSEATRGWVISRMIEIFYVTGVTPLLALFFAAMLIGEDVESQTVSYLLTRPLARSAWVLGRFAAYLLVTSSMILVSIVCLSAAVLPMPAGPDEVGVLELLRYQGAAMMSLFAYGALCAFLGTLVRHPVVVGVLIIFGWQQIALLAPGATHLLTIREYVTTLMPDRGPTVRELVESMASDLINPTVNVSAPTALIVLLACGVAFLALAGAVVRAKEYTTPVAVTE